MRIVRSGESGKVSKGLLIGIGVAVVLGLGVILIAAVVGGYFYYNQPKQEKTIEPAATNSNNIAPKK